MPPLPRHPSIPRYDDTIDQPLHTGEDILDRVRDLIGGACRAQTWLLFLDADDVQLPLLVPVDDLPGEREPLEAARGLLSALAEATEAAAVVAVIESPFTTALSDADRGWARALRDAAAAESLDLRAVLLSQRHGVRALGPDDLRPAGSGSTLSP
ncbi:MAG: hypothetical protein QM635_10380 [Microbacteriaceae bacterium]